jgi:hypothetical protein
VAGDAGAGDQGHPTVAQRLGQGGSRGSAVLDPGPDQLGVGPSRKRWDCSCLASSWLSVGWPTSVWVIAASRRFLFLAALVWVTCQRVARSGPGAQGQWSPDQGARRPDGGATSAGWLSGCRTCSDVRPPDDNQAIPKNLFKLMIWMPCRADRRYRCRIKQRLPVRWSWPRLGRCKGLPGHR